MNKITDKKRDWIVISCQCNLADEEICSWIFFQNGTLGLEIENISDDVIILKASFAANSVFPDHLEDLRLQFKQAGVTQAAETLKAENLADQDWMSNWKKYFVPFPVGDSFFICPPRQTLSSKELGKRKKIIIDPGMAFGTGHVTTKFCLRAIEKRLKGPHILDVGTGSGILAIASVMILPTAHVVAIDIDENAIANAAHNLELNNLENVVELKQTSIQTFSEQQFNTIISNLTAETIVELLPLFDKLLAQGGILILAGIIEQRLAMLNSALSRRNFQQLNKAKEKGGWIGMILRKGNT
jgi:ribosomal protein L11 methyltransferase